MRIIRSALGFSHKQSGVSIKEYSLIHILAYHFYESENILHNDCETNNVGLKFKSCLLLLSIHWY